MDTMQTMIRQIDRSRIPVWAAILLCLGLWVCLYDPVRMAWAQPAPNPSSNPQEVLAVVIPCMGMIDDGLYQSLRRRCEQALDRGAGYLLFEMQTYGGLVKSADDIAKYLILDVGKRARTVAWITTEAISAGAMISVSCRDIIMLENTTIGDCAPILMGDKLEGVEREKQESFIRAAFLRAAEENKYPAPLLKAMVTQRIEVWRVRNTKTGQWEYFEGDALPSDPNLYNLTAKEKIDSADDLLTLTAARAKEYGIARAVVKDLEGALGFLATRDKISFSPQRIVLSTTWSEEMVRWINSPVVMSVLVMLTMLGVYVEFQTPGLGLAGLVAVTCLALIVGSKYMIGMANWIEIAIFCLGIMLLSVELFVFPGFGIAGIAGLVCVVGGLFGMLVRNGPGEAPWPADDDAWQILLDGLLSISAGVFGFLILAYWIGKRLPKTQLFRALSLAPVSAGQTMPISIVAPNPAALIKAGDRGQAITILRPAGQARFAGQVVDVVSEGGYITAGSNITIRAIEGNRVIVREDKT
jgi:membrane-bound serine protease (ClpP class)